MSLQTALVEAAEALIDARRGADALETFPGCLPATLAEAYAVQDMVRQGIGGRVLGWKIGRIPSADVDRLGVERLAGPILTITEGEDLPAAIFPHGAGAVEAEFMLRLTRVPDHIPADNREARLLVDRVCAGIEIASSPVCAIHDYAPFGIIADLGINHGNQLGAEFARDGAFDKLEVTTRIEGEIVGTGRACDILDGPFGAVRFLLGLHFAGTICVEPGQWISAGAITGVHPIAVGQRAEIDVGGRATLACTAVAQMPQRIHA